MIDAVLIVLATTGAFVLGWFLGRRPVKHLPGDPGSDASAFREAQHRWWKERRTPRGEGRYYWNAALDHVRSLCSEGAVHPIAGPILEAVARECERARVDP